MKKNTNFPRIVLLSREELFIKEQWHQQWEEARIPREDLFIKQQWKDERIPREDLFIKQQWEEEMMIKK